MAAKHQNLEIEQGKTFSRTIRWESDVRAYKAISAIANVAPVLITATSHGIPDQWRVGIINVLGMLDINAPNTPPSDNDMVPATYVGVNQISLNSVSAAGFDAYESGGYVVYYVPVDLASFTARATIKDRIGGNVLAEFVTQAGTGFVIDPTAKTIVWTIAATDTEAYEWTEGVYDLEMVSPGGVVTAILSGSATVVDEVTT